MGYSVDVICIPAAVGDKGQQNNLNSLVVVDNKIVPCYSLKETSKSFLIVWFFSFILGIGTENDPIIPKVEIYISAWASMYKLETFIQTSILEQDHQKK